MLLMGGLDAVLSQVDVARDKCVAYLEDNRKTGDYDVFDPPKDYEWVINFGMRLFLKLPDRLITDELVWENWIAKVHFDRLEKFTKIPDIAAVWGQVTPSSEPKPIDPVDPDIQAKIRHLVDKEAAKEAGKSLDDMVKNSISYFKKLYETPGITPEMMANEMLVILDDDKMEHNYLGAMQWESQCMPNEKLKRTRKTSVEAAAEESTKRYNDPDVFGASRELEGIFFVVKDEYWTTDYPVTMGTKELKNPFNKDRTNATFINNLRDKGAILVGKGEMHQLGISLFGINYRTVVRNSRDRTKLPGGSSSGVASVVAAMMGISAGIGSDGGGSIRDPAAQTSLFGWMPSHSTFATDEFGESGPKLCPATDHAGPITHTLLDAGRMYLGMMSPPSVETTVQTSETKQYRVGIEKGWLGKNAASTQLDALRTKLGSDDAKFTFCNVVIPGLPEARAAHLTSIYGEMQKFVKEEGIPLEELLDTTRMSLLIGKALNVGKRQEDAEKYRTIFTEIMKRTYNGAYNHDDSHSECAKDMQLDFLLMPTLALDELPPIEDNFKNINKAAVDDTTKHLGEPILRWGYGNGYQQHDKIKKKSAEIVRYLSIWNLIDVSVISMPLVTGEDATQGTKWGKNAFSVQVIAKNDFKALEGAFAIQNELDKYSMCRPGPNGKSDEKSICIDTGDEYAGKGGNVVNYWEKIQAVIDQP